MKSSAACPGPGLVLVAPGGLNPSAAGPLAQLLGLRLESDPGPQVSEDPAALLSGLGRRPPGWLCPLALDPGQDLGGGSCWAEILAAWHQPVLLQMEADAAASGLARAYGALLQQAGVPLVGLLQQGGPWQAAARRADGLPWLGWWSLVPGDEAVEAALELRRCIWAGWSQLPQFCQA